MSGFTPVTTGNSQRKESSKGARILKRTLAAVAVIVCIAALAYFAVTTAFRMIDSSLEQKQMTALSERTALANLNSAGLGTPDLSAFAHIETGNLIGPRIEGVEVGELTQVGDASGEQQRTVVATAAYRNNSVEIAVPLTQLYRYDDKAGSWAPDPVEVGAPSVTPLRGPSTYALEQALPDLLSAHSPDVAQQFEGCNVSIDSSMTEKGGLAIATLSKEQNKKLSECEVTINASWSATQGWQLTVTSVSKVATSDVANSTNVGDPTMSLTCNAGDLVELDGTIESVNGTAVLRTSETIQVSLGGKRYVVNRFCLTSTDSSRTLSEGSRVTLQGRLTATGTIENAPLSVEITQVG